MPAIAPLLSPLSALALSGGALLALVSMPLPLRAPGATVGGGVLQGEVQRVSSRPAHFAINSIALPKPVPASQDKPRLSPSRRDKAHSTLPT